MGIQVQRGAACLQLALCFLIQLLVLFLEMKFFKFVRRVTHQMESFVGFYFMYFNASHISNIFNCIITEVNLKE